MSAPKLLSLSLPLGAGLLALAPAQQQVPPGGQASPSYTIDARRELIVTDLSVVENNVHVDPGGAWHFGSMMERLAGRWPTDIFIESWLETWLQAPTINHRNVFSQDHTDLVGSLLAEWRAVSNQPDGRVDPDDAPFRLLAIVNRPDLVEVESGQVVSGGEMRFVYGRTSTVAPYSPRSGTVIFEFKVPASSCEDLKDWQQRWHALGSLSVGSPAYLAELLQLTDDATLADPALGLPNDSHIGQVRTNLISEGCTDCDEFFWELREFNIDPVLGAADLGDLINVTTKQTPHPGYAKFANFNSNNPHRGSREVLQDYLNANAASILAGTHVVPDEFTSITTGTPVGFQGGEATNDRFQTNSPTHCDEDNPTSIGPTVWFTEKYGGAGGMSALEADVRHNFAKVTCSGCHGVETGVLFLMMTSRAFDEETQLSRFITGVGYPLPDPLDCSIDRSFNDLAHREVQMRRILDLSCSTLQPESAADQAALAQIVQDRGARPH